MTPTKMGDVEGENSTMLVDCARGLWLVPIRSKPVAVQVGIFAMKSGRLTELL